MRVGEGQGLGPVALHQAYPLSGNDLEGEIAEVEATSVGPDLGAQSTEAALGEELHRTVAGERLKLEQLGGGQSSAVIAECEPVEGTLHDDGLERDPAGLLPRLGPRFPHHPFRRRRLPQVPYDGRYGLGRHLAGRCEPRRSDGLAGALDGGHRVRSRRS